MHIISLPSSPTSCTSWQLPLRLWFNLLKWKADLDLTIIYNQETSLFVSNWWQIGGCAVQQFVYVAHTSDLQNLIWEVIEVPGACKNSATTLGNVSFANILIMPKVHVTQMHGLVTHTRRPRTPVNISRHSGNSLIINAVHNSLQHSETLALIKAARLSPSFLCLILNPCSLLSLWGSTVD